MNRHFFTGAFALGAMVVLWIGLGFVGTNNLALTMTALIGVVFGFGALELRRFRLETSALSEAMTTIHEEPPELGAWLSQVPCALRNAVRLRVEGERVGLPGPSLTPYLVGLLVMLGMLGTFLGMVVTLNGAVFALEGTTDLQSIRSSLAAPIKGLGLAFGTSVAGVGASAMLGLMSALSRRERMLAAQVLDTRIATTLKGFSLTHQRQETFKALQKQSQALPDVVDKLQVMMTQMERLSMQLNERLLSNQESFHTSVKAVYTDLASSVDKSMRDSLIQSAQLATATIGPAVDSALSGIAQEAKLIHERMIDTVQQQLDGLSERFSATASTVSSGWTQNLSQQEQTNASLLAGVERSLEAFVDKFEQRSTLLVSTVGQAYANLQADQKTDDEQKLQAWRQSLESVASEMQQQWQDAGAQTLAQQQELSSAMTAALKKMADHAQDSARASLAESTQLIRGAEALMRSRIDGEALWMAQQSESMVGLNALLRSELGALRDDEASRGAAAVERLGELQTALTHHLTTLGTALEEPIGRLIQTASEAPRAAAEVIGQLRKEVSNGVARDNELLEERSRIMATLNSLLESIHHASVDQRAVIDTLVASSSATLDQAGRDFAEKLAGEAAQLSDVAANVTGSAVEVSSLSDAFGLAVRSFGDANEKLIVSLRRIEASMDKSMARSDDQLAYYVAQAREIIDLSIMSQKEIVEELRQLPGRQASLVEEGA